MNIYNSVHQSIRAGKNYSEIATALSLSRTSVRKYARMSEAEYEKYRKKLERRGRRFDQYREEISRIFELNDPAEVTASSVYDLLEERHGTLPANERSLRNYLQFLVSEGLIKLHSTDRQYLPVAQLPAGRQLQVDFGQEKIASGATAYLFCAILSHSRYRYVSVQDHPFKTREVIDHLLNCFLALGGRPEELVIDQDRLFIVSENAGDIITTQDFGIFISEQDLQLYVCRKADPESKGKVENLVKFVKTSFFSARTFNTVSEIPSKLSLWLTRRANGKICQATGLIPAAVFREEQKHLRPLKASIYLAERTGEHERRKADGKGLISVLGAFYSVPAEYRNRTVEIYLCEQELLVFDADSHVRIATHQKALIPGQKMIQKAHLSRHAGTTQSLWAELQDRSKDALWIQFLEENQRKFPRYRREQASSLLSVLENDAPCQEVLLNAVALCLENDTVSAQNLSQALVYFREVSHNGAPDVIQLVKSHTREHGESSVNIAKRKPSYYSSLISLLAGGAA